MTPIDKISALLDDCRWHEITAAQMRRLKPGTSIAITRGPSTSYDVYRPPRHRDESPVQYHKRTGVVDDHFTRGHKGRYYCNPAHCSRSWASKAERDKHMGIAYDILG